MSYVDPIDEINHMVGWLDVLTDLAGDREGDLRLSPAGVDGLVLLLSHMRIRLAAASESLYTILKDLTARKTVG
jgi:hypothetical protein